MGMRAGNYVTGNATCRHNQRAVTTCRSEFDRTSRAVPGAHLRLISFVRMEKYRIAGSNPLAWIVEFHRHKSSGHFQPSTVPVLDDVVMRSHLLVDKRSKVSVDLLPGPASNRYPDCPRTAE